MPYFSENNSFQKMHFHSASATLYSICLMGIYAFCSCSPIKTELGVLSMDSPINKAYHLINEEALGPFDPLPEKVDTLKIYTRLYNKDDTTRRLSMIQTFGHQNQLLSEQTFDHNSAEYTYLVNHITTYHYVNDQLLLESTKYEDGDSMIIKYHYNDHGLMLKKQFDDYEYRLKPDIDKGYGRPGGCIVEQEDYESERTWAIKSIIHFEYDSLDRQNSYFAPNIHWNSQNRYLWTYDTLNRIKTHTSLENDRIIWKETYHYDSLSFWYNRVWYNDDGSPKDTLTNRHDYTPVYTFYFLLNDSGEVLKEFRINENGDSTLKKVNFYRPDGKLDYATFYKEDGTAWMSQLYKYTIN